MLLSALAAAQTPSSSAYQFCPPALELSADAALVADKAMELTLAFSELSALQLGHGCFVEAVASVRMALVMFDTPGGANSAPPEFDGQREDLSRKLTTLLARATSRLQDAGRRHQRRLGVEDGIANGTDGGARSSTAPPRRRASAESSNKIAIVSLCDYEDDKLTEYSRRNKLRYAHRHQYHFFHETKRADATRPHAWSKIIFVRKYLKRFDWVLWMVSPASSCQVRLLAALPITMRC